MIRTEALENVLALAVKRHGGALVTLCSFQKEESAPCTDRGDGREGRWGGTDKTECGLHV